MSEADQGDGRGEVGRENPGEPRTCSEEAAAAQLLQTVVRQEFEPSVGRCSSFKRSQKYRFWCISLAFKKLPPGALPIS